MRRRFVPGGRDVLVNSRTSQDAMDVRVPVDGRSAMLGDRFEDVLLLLAFTGGLIATVNPCDVAMLPVSPSFFLGMEASPEGARVASAG